MADDLRGRVLGSFEIVEPLGAGAFATVWRARQQRLGRDVAVKVLDPGLSRLPEAARRFEREGLAAAGLDHPAIVPVYEAGEEGGLVYLAMRLVEGETLEDEIARGTLTPARTLDVVAAVADALGHAHGRGVIHRDVKPSNILVEGDRVFLADFGIAATTRTAGRYTTGALGTAAYMAPEQSRPGEIDHRADLYSLGCVVFECLTGHPPYGAGDILESMMAHANDPIPVIGDAGLDAFFARALAKDPADRFTSAGELVVALRSALGVGRVPPTSLPPPVPQPATGGRPRRRVARPLVVAAVVVLVAAAAAVLVASRGSDEQDAAASTSTSLPTTTQAPAPSTSTAAATSTAPPAPVLLPGGSVEIGVHDAVTTLNPHQRVAAEQYVSEVVLPPLFAVDDELQLVPFLAEREPTVTSTDPQVLEFTMRDDAVWDDGSPITSGDVERTLTYVLDAASGAVGTDLYRRVERFETVDDHTFRLVMREPVGEPRVLFSTFHPVIKAAALDEHLGAGRALGDFLVREVPFSGGPLRISGYDEGESIRYVRNESWWGDPAVLDRLTVRTYSSSRSIVDALLAGDLDSAFIPDATQDDRLRAIDAGLSVEATGGPIMFAVGFNLAVPALAERDVRQALAHAIDRQAIVDALVATVTGEPAMPLGSVAYSPGRPEYEDHFTQYRGDLEEAGRLLDGAGWVLDGNGARIRDGAPLSLSILYPNDAANSVDVTGMVILMMEHLAALGVSVRAEPAPLDTMSERWATGAFELSVWSTTVRPDPLAFVLHFSGLRCPASVPGCTAASGGNWWHYDNPAVTELLESTERTADHEQRVALFHEAEALIAADVPILPVFQTPALRVRTSAIGGSVSSAFPAPLAGVTGWGYLAE